MAPCSRTGADSMRQASMAMSWVAAENASQNASSATWVMWSLGSLIEIENSAAAHETCASSIQLRRCPSLRPNSGSFSRSTMGDHRNLKEYASETQASMPTVARLMPTWLNHADSVLKISMKGRPLENP